MIDPTVAHARARLLECDACGFVYAGAGGARCRRCGSGDVRAWELPRG